MRRLWQFVTNMDAQAWRTLAVSFVLFGGVGTVFFLGAPLLGLDEGRTLQAWLTLAQGPLALPMAVLAFAALAFLGVPQIVLIAAAVVAFGPWMGALYSWVGTLVSALVGFWLGRAAGARVLERLSGEGVRRFMGMVGRNGFLASLIVRLVPSAPFIVVNMAAGVTPMRTRDFVAGSAIGIVPKIALTAFAGASIVALMKGEIRSHWLELAVVAGGWIAIGWLARLWMRRREGVADSLDTND
jgi:uncharacterized membrane protein YdjX (TVP38/TMEM64 family)